MIFGPRSEPPRRRVSRSAELHSLTITGVSTVFLKAPLLAVHISRFFVFTSRPRFDTHDPGTLEVQHRRLMNSPRSLNGFGAR